MSSIFNPVGTIPAPTVAFQTRVTIQSSTNATPIVIASTSHGFNNGDYAEIGNHATNTNANGIWTVTVLDANHYSLNGSVGNGVGGATGYAMNYSLTPALQVPGDGDLASAANINTPIEGAACAIPYLYRQAGKYRLYDMYQVSFGTNDGSSYSTTTSSSATFANMTGLSGLFAASFGSSPPAVTTFDVFRYTGWWQTFGHSGSHAFLTTLGVSINGGGYAQVGTAQSAYGPPGAGVVASAMIDGFFGPGACTSFDFSIMGAVPDAVSQTIDLVAGGHLMIQHFRLNGT